MASAVDAPLPPAAAPSTDSGSASASDGPDAAYLRATVGDALARGVAAAAAAQPADPVDFLARWLLRRVAALEAEARRAEERALVARQECEHQVRAFFEEVVCLSKD